MTCVHARIHIADCPLVSPAQEHVQGPEWWTDYQPVSYELTSKRGDKRQYKNMIDTCHEAGVKVIAGQFKREGFTELPFESFDVVSRYYMEPHDSARFRGIGCPDSYLLSR